MPCLAVSILSFQAAPTTKRPRLLDCRSPWELRQAWPRGSGATLTLPSGASTSLNRSFLGDESSSKPVESASKRASEAGSLVLRRRLEL